MIINGTAPPLRIPDATVTLINSHEEQEIFSANHSMNRKGLTSGVNLCGIFGDHPLSSPPFPCSPFFIAMASR
jgi:hypothetical protein